MSSCNLGDVINLVKNQAVHPCTTDEVTAQHTLDGHTVRTGVLPDQTALRGVLMRVRDLGLSLVEVKRIENPTNPNQRE